MKVIGCKDKYKFLFWMACVINIIVFVSFDYYDTNSLTAWSLNIWDLVFGKGHNLGDFYSYTQLNLRGAGHTNCSGNYLWLIPLSIWNFPLWVYCRITETMVVTGFWGLCWSKLFYLLMLFLCAIAVAKLCYHFVHDMEKSAIACILLLLSPEVIMSVDYAGQDEIVYMCALVWAMYLFINRKYIASYLLMVFAVTICPIMILPALVLILAKQKRVIYIFRDVFGMILPLFAFEMFYGGDAIYQTVKQQHSIKELGMDMISDMTVSLSRGDMSIALCLLIVIYFWTYMLREQEGQEEGILYLLASTMVVICFFMSGNFYRMFLYIPFLIVVIIIRWEQVNASIFLLAVISWCRSFYSLTMGYPHNMNMFYLMEGSWLMKLCKILGVNYLNFERGSLGKYFLEGDLIPLFNIVTATCAYTCVGILMLIHFSCINGKNKIFLEDKRFKFELSYDISLYVYCSCMPVILLAFLKMLF